MSRNLAKILIGNDFQLESKLTVIIQLTLCKNFVNSNACAKMAKQI
jgi:hypothetical protein